MKKIVFLTSAFYPFASANGVCVKNAANELIKHGFDVSVLCEGGGQTENVDGINIIHIKDTVLKRLSVYAESKNSLLSRLIYKTFLILRRAALGIVSPLLFPNVSPLRTHAVYKRLEKLYAEDGFDYVIGTFRPYENVEAVNRFKKKHPVVKSEIIYLDLLDGKNPFGKGLKKFFKRLCAKSERRTFKINDLILIPKSSKEKYQSSVYGFAKEKIRFFDFPLFTSEEDIVKIPENNGKINIVYAGSADGENRSAEYFLRLTDKVKERYKIEICVKFYGRFTDRKVREEFADKDYIQFCGMIPPDEVEQVLCRADFLLNLSNRITYKMVPSKIFQMFSTCLPIINMVANGEDASLEYFKSYPDVLNIFEFRDDFENDAESLKNFLSVSNRNKVEFQSVRKRFLDNTPESFVNIII